MEYRIVKRYDRGINEKIIDYYVIQYLGINIFKSIFYFKKFRQWKDCKHYVCYLSGIVKEKVYFYRLEDAKEYIRNLNSPVYSDEVIINK